MRNVSPPTGSVIGPLIIAGVLVDEEGAKALEKLGVKDSKTLSPAQRRALAPKIRRAAIKHSYVRLEPAEIDRFVFSRRRLRKLNFLEAKAMGEVIEDLKPHIAYIDAPDALADRFGRNVKELLSFDVEVISEHKADARYPVVSAASILAKVIRDDAISRLSEEFGCIGSGYSSDPKTIRFLRSWISNHPSYPWFVRKSWATAKGIMHEAKQRHL